MTRTDTARVAELFALLGFAPEAAPKPRGKSAKPRGNTFYTEVIAARVPCAYGAKSCSDKHFAPNGVGSKQHTTCKRGLAALKAAK